MHEFAQKSYGLIFKAIGKTPNDHLNENEAEELSRIYENILTNTSITSPKEIEAYLIINSCRTYTKYADFLIKNKKVNPNTYDKKKLVGRLRTRAHRGREKILKELKKKYETAE